MDLNIFLLLFSLIVILASLFLLVVSLRVFKNNPKPDLEAEAEPKVDSKKIIDEMIELHEMGYPINGIINDHINNVDEDTQIKLCKLNPDCLMHLENISPKLGLALIDDHQANVIYMREKAPFEVIKKNS
jgi:hypothetical protein